MRFALDVPPLVRSKHGFGLKKSVRDSLGQSAALDAADALRAAWAAVGAPAPPVTFESAQLGELMPGNNHVRLWFIRAHAPGGVPPGYAGRTRTL